MCPVTRTMRRLSTLRRRFLVMLPKNDKQTDRAARVGHGDAAVTKLGRGWCSSICQLDRQLVVHQLATSSFSVHGENTLCSPEATQAEKTPSHSHSFTLAHEKMPSHPHQPSNRLLS
jgi:hypothetical protein